MAPLGAIAVSLALYLLGSVHSLWVFYVSFILARGLSSTTVTGVVSQSLAVNWFRRMRGRAFGMIAMAVPLGGSVGAIAAQPIIDGRMAHGLHHLPQPAANLLRLTGAIHLSTPPGGRGASARRRSRA
jgi:MFS family permease